jgi:serine/threonine protein kinase
MATVWQAADQRLHDRARAVKQIKLDASDGEQRNWFRREADTLAALRHPSICNITDWLEEDGRGYLVLELIQGQTLAQDLLTWRKRPSCNFRMASLLRTY